MNEETEAMDTNDTVMIVESSVVEWSIGPQIDDSNTAWSDRPPMDRFVGILDQLDSRVESLRKEAIQLQEKRDMLLLSMEVLKTNEIFASLTENEREEIDCYVKRIGSRLHTVDLNVHTIRDPEQEDSMHQVNDFIDKLIADSDLMNSRQKCQQFLYSCGSVDFSKVSSPGPDGVDGASSSTTTTGFSKILMVDKKFENALLGCTLDDQKIVHRRLQALLTYLIKQSISD